MAGIEVATGELIRQYKAWWAEEEEIAYLAKKLADDIDEMVLEDCLKE